MFVAVVNSKGGVGKSTLAVHAAWWLHERGVKLAVVDADAQASTSEWLAGAGVDLRVERCDTLAQLNERIPRLTSAFDLVLADGPAALSAETVVLAGAADLVLMPIGPSMMDIRASYRTARLLYHVRLRVNQADKPRVVTVLNRVQPRTRLAHVAAAAVHKYGFPVATTALNLRQAYAEACARKCAVWHLGPPGRAATAELDRLFSEVFSRPIDRAVVEARAVPVQAVLTARAPSAPFVPAPAPGYTPPVPAAPDKVGAPPPSA